ncbi:GntR family transcriptional regulator [Ancylobacter oerskovii]|uniref:GntR family transcriptional regulator n=1 Tax=Ancylobacter oerskovii TaxID=459519 RepID=A0ABW4YYY5_9HYPH|nr:GntR family transcriptional regulator [Ancylobacter oerskovii]
MLTSLAADRDTGTRHADRLRQALEADIVTGVFKPGERLDEQRLADRFGVSRTPLREALAQLAANGLVTLQPRRGAFVVSLTFQEIVERFEMMAALEGMCGALAARRLVASDREALLNSLEACRREAADGDSDSYYQANEVFHQIIYRAARNAFLAEQSRQLQARLQPYRRLQLRAGRRIAASFAEHERIVAAILAGDAEGAERELRDHVLIQGDRLRDFFASLAHAGED